MFFHDKNGLTTNKSLQLNSKIIVEIKGFEINSQILILHNGMDQRRISRVTLLAMVRSMLTFKVLSAFYWAKVVHTIFYLRNRCSIIYLDGMKHGMVSNQMLNNSNFFVMFVILYFLRKT